MSPGHGDRAQMYSPGQCSSRPRGWARTLLTRSSTCQIAYSENASVNGASSLAFVMGCMTHEFPSQEPTSPGVQESRVPGEVVNQALSTVHSRAVQLLSFGDGCCAALLPKKL